MTKIHKHGGLATSNIYKSGMTPGDAERGLAAYLAQKRQGGFYIFSKTYINDIETYRTLHNQHLKKIRDAGKREEMAANEHYRGNSHVKNNNTE